MALAFHNYHDAFGHFPPQAITDSDGKPLLSWRVAILPFLEQQALYNEFKLDEPWDSPHNRPLAEKMPAVFACPSHPAQAGGSETNYQGFVGKGTLLGDGTKGTEMRQITDGLSNTLMVVEGPDAVVWTQPEDIPFDPESPAARMGNSYHSGGFNVAFGDGSVRFIRNSVDITTFQRLGNGRDGLVINGDY